MYTTIPLWMKVLPGCNEVISTKLSKDLDVTYSHIVKLIQEFEKNKWITTERRGRVKIIYLTGLGKTISDVCLQVSSYINNGDSKNE